MEQKRAHLEQLAAFSGYLYHHPRLRFLFLELTDACNLACLHCGSNASPANKNFLSLQRIEKVLTETAERYDPREILICITGGEPLLHPDFFTVVRRVRELGFSWGMTTNGTLLDAATARRLQECGMASVSVSLDGLQKTHEWFRCGKHSYNLALQGLKDLLQYTAAHISATTVVHRRNLQELDALHGLLCSVGVPSWRLVNLDPIGRAARHPDLMLRGKELKQMLETVRRLRRESPLRVTYGCAHYLGLALEGEVRDHYFLCNAGVYTASILCTGEIFPCLDVPRRPDLIQGHVDSDHFPTVWETRFETFRRSRAADNPTCAACPDAAFCRGGPAHTWDYTENKPLICIKNMIEGEDS